MKPAQSTSCTYPRSDGSTCPHPGAGSGGLCFWHDPAQDKTGPDLKERLEALVREGASLEGFLLREAALTDAHLSFSDLSHRVNLRNADLSRANLNNAHLFNADLRGAVLMKAHLNQANLNQARLDQANLLGTELEHAHVERVAWGRHLRQAVEARAAQRAGRVADAIALYGEAEEIYRHLTGVHQRLGHFNRAGVFYRHEKVMQRMQMRRFSAEWGWSKLVDVLCGYGEDSYRVIGFSLSVVLCSAVIYFLLGVRAEESLLRYEPGAGFAGNAYAAAMCLYYSVVTFTTLGYGDITPVGLARAVAALEAFVGAFSISLFVVVFVRKMMR